MNQYTLPRSSDWSSNILFVALALVPLLPGAIGSDYYVGFVARLMTVSIAVMGLNFLIGHAGMVALGHAGFVGVGAYVVAAMVDAGSVSAWQVALAAVVGSGLVAAIVGAISLRTSGVYFIMITLAFAQMLYYLAVSLRRYGGDDGYTLPHRLVLAQGVDSANVATMYWVVLCALVLVFHALSRASRSRLGKALHGVRDNETRMRAMGYSVYWLKLITFVAMGAVAGLSGGLMAMQNGFVSPATMHWTQSALLIVMVVVGGTGHRWGPVLGVAVWMVLEEALKPFTDYWHLPLGLMLIAIVFYAPHGVAALRRKVL